MPRRYDIVEINLPEIGHKEPPDPNRPHVSVNGTPIHRVVSVKIDTDAHSITKVSITFFAEVHGKLVTRELVENHELDEKE